MKKTSKILRRILSFVIISIMLLGMLPPAQVKAGHACPICEEWIDDGEYCILCYCCDDCTSYWCEECGLCAQCVSEEEVHCSDCG